MLGEGGPAGVGWMRYFHLTQTSCSSRRHMDDPAFVRTTPVPLAHGWRYFEEMLMPSKIGLCAMRRLREQRLQPLPQVRLDDCFQAMGPGAVQRVVPAPASRGVERCRMGRTPRWSRAVRSSGKSVKSTAGWWKSIRTTPSSSRASTPRSVASATRTSRYAASPANIWSPTWVTTVAAGTPGST
jgi:hypothetical protein